MSKPSPSLRDEAATQDKVEKTKPIFALPSVKTVEAEHEMGIIKENQIQYETKGRICI